MQAILVKYSGPTNTRGGGYSARAAGGSVRLGRDYSLSDAADRARVALALCAKLGCTGTLHEGTLPNGDHVFVFDNGSSAYETKSLLSASRNRAGAGRRSTKKRAKNRSGPMVPKGSGRGRKTRYEYAIEVNYGYGHGWEHEISEDTLAEARKRRDEYRTNAPQYPVRIRKRRVNL